MDYIYSLIDYLSSVAGGIYAFIVMIPNYVIELFSYAGLWLFNIWLDTKLFMLEVSLGIAQKILSEYGVYDLIELAFNQLPNDIRVVLSAYGIPTGLRILFDAYATSFVLRVAGW